MPEQYTGRISGLPLAPRGHSAEPSKRSPPLPGGTENLTTTQAPPPLTPQSSVRVADSGAGACHAPAGSSPYTTSSSARATLSPSSGFLAWVAR